jgi:hypothetical protein
MLFTLLQVTGKNDLGCFTDEMQSSIFLLLFLAVYTYKGALRLQ